MKLMITLKDYTRQTSTACGAVRVRDNLKRSGFRGQAFLFPCNEFKNPSNQFPAEWNTAFLLAVNEDQSQERHKEMGLEPVDITSTDDDDEEEERKATPWPS